MSSEAGYRFSRGVHPSLAESGVKRGLELMRQWTGGIVSDGFVDNYPNPPIDPEVEFTAKLLKNNISILELPISYSPRKFGEGKKINWRDGIKALWLLVKYKFKL